MTKAPMMPRRSKIAVTLCALGAVTMLSAAAAAQACNVCIVDQVKCIAGSITG